MLLEIFSYPIVTIDIVILLLFFFFLWTLKSLFDKYGWRVRCHLYYFVFVKLSFSVLKFSLNVVYQSFVYRKQNCIKVVPTEVTNISATY